MWLLLLAPLHKPQRLSCALTKWKSCLHIRRKFLHLMNAFFLTSQTRPFHFVPPKPVRPINSNVYWKQPQRAKINSRSPQTLFFSDHSNHLQHFRVFAAFHIFSAFILFRGKRENPLLILKRHFVEYIFLFEGTWRKKWNAKRHFEKRGLKRTVIYCSFEAQWSFVQFIRSDGCVEISTADLFLLGGKTFCLWKRIRKHKFHVGLRIKAIINKGKSEALVNARGIRILTQKKGLCVYISSNVRYSCGMATWKKGRKILGQNDDGWETSWTRKKRRAER